MKCGSNDRKLTSETRVQVGTELVDGPLPELFLGIDGTGAGQGSATRRRLLHASGHHRLDSGHNRCTWDASGGSRRWCCRKLSLATSTNSRPSTAARSGRSLSQRRHDLAGEVRVAFATGRARDAGHGDSLRLGSSGGNTSLASLFLLLNLSHALRGGAGWLRLSSFGPGTCARRHR